jgi:hypothetical protein
MTETSKIRVPDSFTMLLGLTAVVWSLVLVHVFVVKGSWESLIQAPPQTLAKVQLERRVWANVSTGVYYCPDSALYGHTSSGQYMNQGEALQKGYTPALNVPCR